MNKYKYTVFACLLALPVAVPAQKVGTRLAGNAILIENKTVGKADNTLVVDMDLNMDSLKLPADTRFVFTPVVKGGGNEKAMPQIVVNGRRQDISYQRKGGRQFGENATVVRRKNGTEQTLHYSAVLPYEEWMKNADVVISEALCGCGDVKDNTNIVIQRLRTPYMAYLRPAAEARKERHEEGSAYIEFPVDKIVLYPDYRQNPRELDKIVSTINKVKEDKNVTITSVSIHGYASPESPYKHNAYLAENRAITLKNYVRKLVHLDDNIFTVESTPEDWDKLRTFVAGSNLDNKDAILALIDDKDLDLDAKEWRIKLKYPGDYAVMLNSWYPALRHSDYVVRYSVRPFSVEEAKEILKTKPQQLSLEEMFLVAQTYEPGSEEFVEVFDIAVKMYPNDPTANLNAACSEIEKGEYAAAERHLAKAGDTPYAEHARGVIAMKQGDYEAAEAHLRKAAAGGVKEAQRNLDILNGVEQ